MLNCKKNASRTANSRSAFTLIELSIVLIIIGLLVAGITGGAKLINSAKLRSVMTDANAYRLAANNFYGQYKSLPGDFDIALSSSGGVGNKNGVIEFSDNTISETDQALIHLVDSKIMLDATTITTAGTTASTELDVGDEIPEHKDYDNLGFILGSRSDVNYVLGGGDFDAIADTSSTYANAAFSGLDALSIDLKMDDGVIDAGEVRGFSGGDTAAIANCSYDTDEVLCTLAWEVEISPNN